MHSKACSFCGSANHTSLTCYKKRKGDYDNYKKRPLARESKASANKRAILYNTFFSQNPPESNGKYICYLQITKACPVWMDKKDVTMEHVLPKSSGKYPEVKHNVINIKAACEYCNEAKQGSTPYHLALLYPHIMEMVNSPEWKEWERQITPFLNRPLPQLW